MRYKLKRGKKMDRLEKKREYKGTVLHCERLNNSSMGNPNYRFIIQLANGGIYSLDSAANASFAYSINFNSIVGCEIIFTVNGWNKIASLKVV